MVRRRERWPYLLFMIVVTLFQIPNSTELFRCTLSCSTFSRDAASCACAGQFPATTWSTRPCGGGWRVCGVVVVVMGMWWCQCLLSTSACCTPHCCQMRAVRRCTAAVPPQLRATAGPVAGPVHADPRCTRMQHTRAPCYRR